jgi:acetyl-CoA carboxylase, biotin carboxylase subunit
LPYELECSVSSAAMKMFKKILIANRGEIAVRVIRACHELGIAAATVFSEVDRSALHVQRADEAYPIGPASAADSYLNIERILDVAKKSGADAIHPGYGFLSENPSFARACQQAGVKFIGPPASAMEAMGSKTRARQNMEKAGVPFVPGTATGLRSAAEAEQVATSLGFPVMLKAAAGGGGKGMRLIDNAADLPSAFEAARSEASRAFGDDEVYLEKAIVNPRHIEMQVLADEHGNTAYLGERDCSIQRRHQKVVEEAPSPVVGPEMRRHMGEIAVRAAQAVGYTNAGTIEFLADEQGDFYFLEMNTRLQVEHPVTELVTGLDLVQLQIRIAAGEQLPFRQQDVQLRGHAIECRVYAEDPENNYFPSPGRITSLTEPSGPGIRLDSGIYTGWNVPMEYDPLLAKLIGYGESRQQAVGRLRRALDEYYVGGIKTNLPLFRHVLQDQDFLAGKANIGFLSRLASRPHHASPGRDEEIAVIGAGIFQVLARGGTSSRSSDAADAGPSAWKHAARKEALS